MSPLFCPAILTIFARRGRSTRVFHGAGRSSLLESTKNTKLIIVTTVITGGGVLFPSWCTFAKRTQNVCLFWPIFGVLMWIYVLCSVLFYRPSVVVYQNWQISGMQKYQIFFKTETHFKNSYSDSHYHHSPDHPDKCPRDHEWSQRLFSWPGHHRPSPSHASSTSASQLKCIFPNYDLGFP